MFTGIITALGTVVEARQGRFRIDCPYDAASIAIGASIACDGCCLTVTAVAPDGRGGSIFDVDASAETLRRTTLGDWRTGTQINLERSLGAGEEMGGHIVLGHVDGVAEILEVAPEGTSQRFDIACPASLAPFIAPKGSVALDGTSLTVNEVNGTRFSVNLIPHTLAVTTWGRKRAGERLNLEVDVIARYVARLMETKHIMGPESSV